MIISTSQKSLGNNSSLSKERYRPQGAINMHPQSKKLQVDQSIEKINFFDQFCQVAKTLLTERKIKIFNQIL